MLNNLSDQIRKCYQHAESCTRKGAAQVDPKLERWLSSTRSYQCTAQLDDFSDAAKP